MNIEITTGNCTNCKGVDNCTKYCMMHAGKALVDFLTRVDMVETRIGEYEARNSRGPLDLVVHGHQLYELDSPTWLLTDINITLDASNKFSNVFGKTATQLINNYCSKIGMTPEETKELTNKIAKLNKNRLLVLPFKPHTTCSIDVDVDGVNMKKKSGKIFYVKWVTDRNNYKLKCEIAFDLDGDSNSKLYKIPVTEYIDKFRLSSLELQAKAPGQDAGMIKMTDYGMIKPIVIKDGNSLMAIDGTYVYSTVNSDTRIVGYWNDKDELVVSPGLKSQAYLRIKDNEKFIKHHKKYIAPYMLYDANVIEL